MTLRVLQDRQSSPPLTPYKIYEEKCEIGRWLDLGTTDMMQTTPLSEEDTPVTSGVTPDAAGVDQTAGKAFDLIDRHRTPPSPQAYALWYAYVSGNDPLLVARVDEVIAAKGELSLYDIESIHWELVATGATMQIGDAIEREIESVLGTIRQGAASNDVYHASLSAVGSRITDSHRSKTSRASSPDSSRTIGGWQKPRRS
jgi:hypothetical protein